MAKRVDGTVMTTGADPGDILMGISRTNREAIIEVFECQPPNQAKAGRINGSFIVHSPGYGQYSEAFLLFLGQTTTADELLASGRKLGDTFARMKFPVNTDNLKLAFSQDEPNQAATASLVVADAAELPERVAATTNRIIRDTVMARNLKRYYDFTCQVCGVQLPVGDNSYYIEVHHIRPLGGSHNGTDVYSNMIVVCPNHHALFDYGIIRFTSSREVEILGEKYALTLRHQIKEENWCYHNENLLR